MNEMKEWNAGIVKAINAGKNTNGKVRLSIYIPIQAARQMNIIPGDLIDLGQIKKVGHEAPGPNRFRNNKKTESEEKKIKKTETDNQEVTEEELKEVLDIADVEFNSNPVGESEAETIETKTPQVTPEPVEEKSTTAPQVTIELTEHEKAFVTTWKQAKEEQRQFLNDKATEQFGYDRVDLLIAEANK